MAIGATGRGGVSHYYSHRGKPETPPSLDGLKIDWFKFLVDLAGKQPKGKSSLTKWTCPECGLNVRIGIKGDPQIRHHTCEEKTGLPVFSIKAEGLDHQMRADVDYEAPKMP